jgi:hypothetical protein
MALHGNPLTDAAQADKMVALHDDQLTVPAQANKTTA